MATIELENIAKSYGAHPVLRHIDLKIEDGEFIVLVGPSGCGKSTLLRMIAGLESITAGEMRIDGVKMNDVAPRNRDIAMVFQSYALYPHMDVGRNMGFSMEIRGEAKEKRLSKVAAAAKTLGLDKLTARLPRALSGGQRQRVAMGRAIVRDPKAFLFDEPLSNLDAALRVEMRLEIARLHKRLGATMIYVTHDQVEALTLADRIVVMQGGIIQQVGSPLELYERPANKFVAQFIGSPTMNILAVTDSVLGNGLRLKSARNVVEIGVRPEHLELADYETAPLKGMAELVEHLGSDTNIYAQIEGIGPMMIRQHGHIAVKTGDQIGATFHEGRIYGFDISEKSLGADISL